MAMGRSRSALPDLDEAIKLNPKFSQVPVLNLLFISSCIKNFKMM
jgi:hypothetical protein